MLLYLSLPRLNYVCQPPNGSILVKCYTETAVRNPTINIMEELPQDITIQTDQRYHYADSLLDRYNEGTIPITRVVEMYNKFYPDAPGAETVNLPEDGVNP
jgi:hypothetical protein